MEKDVDGEERGVKKLYNSGEADLEEKFDEFGVEYCDVERKGEEGGEGEGVTGVDKGNVGVGSPEELGVESGEIWSEEESDVARFDTARERLSS